MTPHLLAHSSLRPLVAFFCTLATSSGANGREAIDFQRDIRPLLQKHCYECHDEKKQKGGLRLDRKADLTKGGDSGELPLAPGKDGVAPLIQRVLSDDDDEKMPPKGERLTPEEIAVLKAWIAQGAAMPDDSSTTEAKHWAYQKPVQAPLPAVNGATRPRHGLDHFILARLEKEALLPSPEAPRAVLLRRVSLDLTGLPPTLAEVDSFLADTSADAYEKAVDRLLASPAFGERWARPWLDAARYADTQGYEKDNRRSMWPWRDWVIKALNADLPFDQFTVEQIAGDMLPHATQDQRVATGFHRNTMTNTEGGTDNEEFRYEALIDRVNTTFGVWMGTTFACAQCHNHKYDPLATKEYFQVMAFLNSTEDADSDDERPTMKVVTPAHEAQLASLRGEVAAAEKSLADFVASPAFATSQTDWERRAVASGDSAWRPLDPVEFVATSGAKIEKGGGGVLLVRGDAPSKDDFTITVKTQLAGITGFRLEALPDDSLPKKGPGRSADGNIILSELKVTVNGQPVALKDARADFQQEGWPVAAALDGNPETGWAWAPQFGVPHQATFAAVKPIGDGSQMTLLFTLQHQNSQWAKHVLGKFRLSTTTAAEVAPSALPADVGAALAIAPGRRDEAQKAKLREHFKSLAPEVKPLAEAIATAKKKLDDVEKTLPVTSVMAELPKPREMRRHIRGAYLSPGEVVTPATPAALHPFPKDQPLNRLGFARWLVDGENPLTARVTVNTFWEQYFGKGIVETTEEFGKQGEAPSHPELLDWLAVEFMNGARSPHLTASSPPVRPWSVKALHRLIVTSATYRQSSKVSPELLDRDPFNRLLARGPRVRLEAETLRDQALAVSGLLSRKIGGPSVMPPQPDGLWQVVYSGDKWTTSAGEDKYRRGLYTFWRRSVPHPMMTTFDAPTREFCVQRRSRSNTPLQALNTLNDPQFIEAAQALARRIATAPAGDTRARVAWAFRTCLSRSPNAAELDRLTRYFESEFANFSSKHEAAAKMAASELGKPVDGANMAELAAWTVVANVLLNLDELITKG